jgi:hypothetical protein
MRFVVVERQLAAQVKVVLTQNLSGELANEVVASAGGDPQEACSVMSIEVQKSLQF